MIQGIRIGRLIPSPCKRSKHLTSGLSAAAAERGRGSPPPSSRTPAPFRLRGCLLGHAAPAEPQGICKFSDLFVRHILLSSMERSVETRSLGGPLPSPGRTPCPVWLFLSPCEKSHNDNAEKLFLALPSGCEPNTYFQSISSVWWQRGPATHSS